MTRRPPPPKPRPRPRPDPDDLPQSYFFQTWEMADKLVPFPYTYWWVARPFSGRAPRRLEDLRRWDFCYRITNDFTIHLSGEDRAFNPGILRRENYAFRLMATQGRQGMITPEGAEQILERYLECQQGGFWRLFLIELEIELSVFRPEKCLEHYRRLEWQSLRFEQPFAAGVIEPVYKFRKARSRCEFSVGARTGRVKHEHVPA